MGRTEQSILIILVISTAAFYKIQAEDDRGHKPDPSHDQHWKNKTNEAKNGTQSPEGPLPGPEHPAHTHKPDPSHDKKKADKAENAIKAEAPSPEESSEENEPDPEDTESIPYVHSTLYFG